MDPKQIAKQLLNFNKTAFDNTFSAMSVMQDQMEKMLDVYFDQVPGFPEEGKRMMQNWIESFKQGRNQLKNAADENFKKVEDFLSGIETGKSKLKK